MEVKQIYETNNEIINEVLGNEAVLLKEDLSNIVDIGTEFINANALDKYCRAMVDKVGKMVFVNRVYKGSAPKIRKDGWEFGAILQKVRSELPKATENESWELTDGAVYEQDTFHKPVVSVKFFSKKVTWEVDISITELQIKSAFTSAQQMNSFMAMIYAKVEDRFTLDNDNLTMRLINAMIGETLYDLSSVGTYTTGNVRAVNLYAQYKAINPNTTLTASNCIYDKEFLRFASMIIKGYPTYLKRYSTLFNIGGKEVHTPNDLLHVVMLGKFVDLTETYLQSDTFHNDLVKLPLYEKIDSWQGTGTSLAWGDISKIYITTPSGHDVTCDGILGVMFDDETMAIANENRRVKTHENGKAEFYNFFYKEDVSYFADCNENFVVFFVK